MLCIKSTIYNIKSSNNTIIIVDKQRKIVNQSQHHLYHYLYLQNQSPHHQIPSLLPYQSPTHLLIQLHCMYKCLSLVIRILWYSALKIWCTCLLEYFDLVNQVISFEIRDNLLVKNNGSPCKLFCVLLHFLFFLLSFFN